MISDCATSPHADNISVCRTSEALQITTFATMQQLRGHRLPAMSSIHNSSISRTASVAQPGRQRHIAHAHRRQQDQRTEPVQQQQQQQHGLLRRVAVAAAAAALVCAPMAVPPGAALATDTVKVGTCLLQKCQVELAKCLGDPKCFQNIVCLNTCNGLSPEDEAACQIRCGCGQSAAGTAPPLFACCPVPAWLQHAASSAWIPAACIMQLC